MTMNARKTASIARLPTGVPGLDEVLGGGLPEYSFNLIAGAPGSGKTTLSQQILFAMATHERPALHFTVMGEPLIKMLRYQQQFTFFDPAKVHSSIHYRNLSDEVLQDSLDTVLATIIREVEQIQPGIVVVDSFRAISRRARVTQQDGLELQGLLQRLALHLTAWQATTFLVGDYLEEEMKDSPVFTIADGIFWLYQSAERNSIVRKMQIMKMRGQAPLPGLHTTRITNAGLQVFPRIIKALQEPDAPRSPDRLSTGTPALDDMLGGGVPMWDSILVAGPSGSGKTALAVQFIAEGLKHGEPAVVAVFEERPREYSKRIQALFPDVRSMVDAGSLEIIYLRPLDLSVDEALLEIQNAVKRVKAQRLAIDSLSGFELALAPTFRDDFRESLYRMVSTITGSGVTVFMTSEVAASFTNLQFSPDLVSFLTDNIILQRYVEVGNRLRKVLTVVKMRRSGHSDELRLYEITDAGMILGEPLTDHTDIITGVAHWELPRAESR